MRRGNLLESLKYFIASKPPLIVFLICLLCFFVILAILMIHLNTHDIKNPDIIDWNTFKKSLSSLNYCIKLNDEKETQIELNDLLSKKSSKTEKLTSFSFQTHLTLQIDDANAPIDNISSLYGRIEGYQIGLLQVEALQVSFHLIDSQDIKLKYELKQNSDLCRNENNPLNKNNLNDCREVKIKVCANLVAPSHVFPKSKSPQSCIIHEDSEKYKRVFNALKETPDLPYQFQCPAKQGIKTKINHKMDPSLTVMLTEQDKETINMYLRNCMLLIAISTTIIISYGIVNSRNRKQNIVYQPVNQL